MKVEAYLKLAENYTVQIGEYDFLLLRIRDIDELFSHLLKKGPEAIELSDERMPYWAELWPSAIGLSMHLLKNRKAINGKKIIELGCGLGLPGIVASKLNGDVLMTDYLAEALSIAKVNWKKNLTTKFKGMKIDWRNVKEDIKYDVILASDVAYESRSFLPLLSSLKLLLKKDGVIYISEPNRKFTSPFIEMLSKVFLITKFDHTVVLDSISYVVSIYECKFIGKK